MFVLDELDKILQNLTLDNKRKRDRNRLQISLPDVTRVELNYKELDIMVNYPPDITLNNTNKHTKIFEKLMESNPDNLSSDTLFVSLISPMILTRLNQIPERHYASARLMICDRYSYNQLMKLKSITTLRSSNNHTIYMKNFIYKPPNNITAIFLLRDVVDLIDREQEPILIQKRDQVSGKQVLNLNYSLIRRVFPFLKMSDLVVMLRLKGDLDLTTFKVDISRENMILQYFSHFARTSHLIELDNLNKSIGNPHLIYDNVLISQPIQIMVDGTYISPTSRPMKLPLVQVAFMAKQLTSVLDKLCLMLSSISYRKNDPSGQTRFFAQFISTSSAKASEQVANAKNYKLAKLLILDRYYDLQQALFHADRYGSFLEQEKPAREAEDKADYKLRMSNIDDLYKKLQLEKLTDVLSAILKYTADLKPKELKNFNAKDGISLVQPKHSFANAMATSQSIKRHLDMVKVVYKCLNDGYLLIIKLESSLELITDELRNLSEPATGEQQDQLVEKIQRVEAAFKLLMRISGKTIDPSDIIRLVCTLIDTINLFFHKHNISVASGKGSTVLSNIRKSLLSIGDLKKALKVKLGQDEQIKKQFNVLADKLTAFDTLSRETCGQKSRETIEQMIEGLYAGNLDQDYYPATRLADSTTNAQVIVLVFLGSLTPNELSKIKAFEVEMRTKIKSFELLIMTYELIGPENFLTIL